MHGKQVFLFMLILPGVLSHAATAPSASATVIALAAQREDHLENFYKDLHENPELSGEEKRTAAKVAAEMRELGLTVTEGVGGYGVIGVLHNGPGPTTLIRTELDALPVPEDTGAPFKSQVSGKMHACGHDFHAASLMGVAYVMTKTKDQWSGTLEFLAQPAEELGHGAAAMIHDHLFEKIPKPDQLIALHTSGAYKKGAIGVGTGFVLANADTVLVTFRGRGTHGSKPESGIDPFIQSAEFTLKLQTLLGREKSASVPAVISIGSIHGGTKANIIPDEVKMELTVRTYSADLRNFLEKRIREVAAGIAKTNDAPEPLIQFNRSADATYNDPKLADRLKKVFEKELGSSGVIDIEAQMASEDFGEFGKAVGAPSVFFIIGERDEKKPNVSNHSPRYLPDLRATLPTAIRATVAGLMELQTKISKP
jgi:amidohydrolase